MSGLTPEIETLGIGLGLLLALVCYLSTNLSPGGMITPGWLAILLVIDVRRILPLATVVGLTYFAIVAIRRVVILYGKRLFAAVMTLGIFIHASLFLVLFDASPQFFATTTLGFIVPGLLAYQFVRQPLVPTLIATASVTGLTYCVMLAGVLLQLIPVARGPVVIGRFGAAEAVQTSVFKIALVGAAAGIALVLLALSMRGVQRAPAPVLTLLGLGAAPRSKPFPAEPVADPGEPSSSATGGDRAVGSASALRSGAGGATDAETARLETERAALIAELARVEAALGARGSSHAAAG